MEIHIIGSALIFAFAESCSSWPTDGFFVRTAAGLVCGAYQSSYFGSCNLYLRRMSSKEFCRSRLVQVIARFRARSLCRPTLAAIAMICSGRKTFAGMAFVLEIAKLCEPPLPWSGRGKESNRKILDKEMSRSTHVSHVLGDVSGSRFAGVSPFSAATLKMMSAS